MFLYERALRFKRLAEYEMRRGNIEIAKRYALFAREILEKLINSTKDPIKRRIFEVEINNIDMLLSGLNEFSVRFPRAQKAQMLEKTITKTKIKSKIKERPKRVSSKATPKAKTRKQVKIPEEYKKFLIAEIPDITFNDVAGFENIKQELREAIEWQLKYPHLLKELRLKPLKGILLYGPPGTGKTYLVKAAAGEFNIPIILADPATITSKWFGESEKIVSKMFECARKCAPCILFVDEIDKVLPREATGTSEASKRIEAQFLQEMDGVKTGEEGFIIVFATNEPWNISPALIRPGRIDRIIYVGPPDDEARKEIFKIHLRNIPLGEDIDFDELVELTKPNEIGYYSASGIAQICNEAKKILLRRWTSTGKKTPLTMSDLIEAIKRVPRSVTHEMVKKYENWAKSLSY